MAGSKSDYLENKMLDLVLGGGTFTKPGTVYLALYTVAPSDTGGGTEVSGGNYARLPIANNSVSFPNATDGVKTNGIVLLFDEATVDYGTLVAWALFDAASGGNMLYWGTLTTSKQVSIGDVPMFNTGELIINED